jgi:outer membrane receptor protein involved in Fe transport
MSTLPLLFLVAAALQGRVIDLGREQPVAGARVTVVETGATAVSDEGGRFSLSALAPGSWTLRVRKPPYETMEVTVDIGPDGQPTAPVEIGVFDQVEKVNVVEMAPREKPAPGGTQVLREEITVVPGARGDVLTAVQSLPGIAQTGAFNVAGGLVIRGSSPADSAVFVDGVKVPLVFHFFNLQSILPSEMIDDVVYAPGGFGVEHGRASGGIIEVRSRTAAAEYHGAAELSFINAAGWLQGPLLGPSRAGRHDPTFALAFRRSFIDAILPQVMPDDADLKFTALPRYYDYQARLDWLPTDRWRLGLFVFGTSDAFGVHTGADSAADPVLTGAHVDNTTNFLRAVGSATYQSARVESRTGLALVAGSFNLEIGPDRYLHLDSVGGSARNETRIRLLPRLAIRVGGEGEWTSNDRNVKFPRSQRDGDPRNPNFTYDPPLVENVNMHQTYIGAWTAMDLDLSSRLMVGGGVRYDAFLYSHDQVFQPRGEAKLKLREGTTVRLAGGLYTRAPDNYEEVFETHLDPERAWQATMGVEHQLTRGLTVQTTAFHTWRSDLIVFETSRADPSRAQRAFVNRGTGRTYGGELFLQARGERTFGWLAYTLSRSVRRDISGGSERLFDYDQTHNLIVVGSWVLGARQQWRLGGRFQYTSGKPYTPVNGAALQSDLNYYTPEFGAINSRRFEAQHQLDLRVDRLWRFQRWRLAAYLDVTNVYAHAAPLQQQYNYDYSKIQPINSIPILPAVGLRGDF